MRWTIPVPIPSLVPRLNVTRSHDPTSGLYIYLPPSDLTSSINHFYPRHIDPILAYIEQAKVRVTDSVCGKSRRSFQRPSKNSTHTSVNSSIFDRLEFGYPTADEARLVTSTNILDDLVGKTLRRPTSEPEVRTRLMYI